MNIFKAALDTRHQNGVIGTVTQFDNAVLELQIVTDGQVSDAWEEPQFELIAMKRDANAVREVDQDRFTILSKEEHRVQIELKEQFLTCRGTVKMQLVVKDGSRLSTTLFYLVIGQSLDHDIVESHRDVAVLDELEAYIKQGFDDLAYQEQRMAAVEQSTNDLNDTMNANEAERNAAETKRSQMFETNETNRTQTFNNQIEEQSIAFSNAQTQREKDFSESQQNMSQEFETSQKERESDFNELQKSNQKTFETNEQKRQTTFAQSQSANKQTFTQDETERQHIFESNESSRQKSESQRVQNESERVLAETKRADAEVIRKQKMTDFEEKATQLSEDLDNQVARVDGFVSANEEKLLGAHDKTDYMGNAHKSVKDVNDANVEYILGEVNTVHYEGQHITATDTIEKQVRSAILKGNTLVNILSKCNITISSKNVQSVPLNIDFQVGKSYIIKLKINSICEVEENVNSMKIEFGHASLNGGYIQIKSNNFVNGYQMIEKITYSEQFTRNGNVAFWIPRHISGSCNIDVVVIEYQDGMENWDIPYFEGMQSVKLPVLTTTGKNLFNQASEIGAGSVTNIDAVKYTYDSSTNTSCVYSSDWHGGYRHYLKVIPNKTYFFYSEVTWGIHLAINCDGQRIAENIISGTDSGDDYYQSKVVSFVPTTDEIYIAYAYRTLNRNGYARNIVISDVNITSYEPYKTNILTTSEDVELRGIGDVQDTLNCLTGEVTERIGEIVLNGSESWVLAETNENTIRCYANNILTAKNHINVYNDTFKTVNQDIQGSNDEENLCIRYNLSGTGIRLLKTKASNLSEFKTYLSQNPITVQYELATESVKTVDLSCQKVYSYDGTTHYSCSAAEGALIPTLSIDVPTNLPALVSRQRTTIESQKEQIITLEQENEQLIAQNEVQDIDISLNQDAINFMLFAPATMLLNDESRNNEGVNAMAAYLANQILKGKLDYALVVGRYGSYKEDIDTILIAEGKQDLIK